MNSTAVSQPTAAGRVNWLVIAAFFAIYVIWGSTFLAIRITVLLVPPWFAAGTRFFTAGLILFAYARVRGVKAPTLPEWRNLVLVGVLMFSVTYGLLFWAEQKVPSGITAVMEAMIPTFTLLLEVFALRQQRMTWTKAIAVMIGFLGVAIMLLKGGSGSYGILSCLGVLGAGLSWSLGATLTRSLRLPESRVLTSGAEMMLGGGLLLVASMASGELRPFPAIPLKAVYSLLYLILAGSLVGYTAFVYLLGRMPASRVASHAYVNPVVAVALGYFFAGEAITTRTLAGAALVLGSVLLTLRAESRSPANKPTPTELDLPAINAASSPVSADR
jgi:drug/metabolite transporter (DMT)-like permease